MTYEYISKQGLEKLKSKLQHLIQEERPDVIEQIAIARQFGDLSENAEYHAAKERQRFIEAEISKIQHKVSILKIIYPDMVNKNEVRFGAIVELFDLNKNKYVIYKVVGEDETGKENNIRKISCNSPIAKALLGKKVGEEVKVKAPASIIKYKIISIKY
ncbi:MAG: transcription elongation factor GreA [Candidatus Cloacimonetes bacterium]|nr:transcription elongation factor GreA [Candidatus Cloacimonadota bacterium]